MLKERRLQIMGTKYRFACGDCGYRTVVSGGRDVGMMARTQTVACAECRELHDVTVGVLGDGRPGGDASIFGSRPLPPLLPAPVDTDDYIARTRVAVCPVDAAHQVTDWFSPGTCPRCGAVMSGGSPSDAEMMWD
jgi:transcription elongation factor Elf1